MYPTLALKMPEAGKGITAVDQEETDIGLSIQQVLWGGVAMPFQGWVESLNDSAYLAYTKSWIPSPAVQTTMVTTKLISHTKSK